METRAEPGTKTAMLASFLALLILATGIFGVCQMNRAKEAFLRVEREEIPLLAALARLATLLEVRTDHLEAALLVFAEEQEEAGVPAPLQGLRTSFQAAGSRLAVALAEVRARVEGDRAQEGPAALAEEATMDTAAGRLADIVGGQAAFELEARALLAALAEGDTSDRTRERLAAALSHGAELTARAEAFRGLLQASAARSLQAVTEYERALQTAAAGFTLLACLLGILTVAGILRINRERREALSRLEFMAIHDPLSGLYNRREFLARLEVAVAAAHRYEHPLALCLCDLDDFKKVNDTHGHPAGDEVIRQVGQLIRKEIRTDDFAGRYGGDEFCVALSHTSAITAREVMERIRSGLAALAFRDPQGRYFQVSASFGLADLDPEQPARTVLIDQADQALYRAKGTGRNRVEVRSAFRPPAP